MICTKCGAENDDWRRFCRDCGHKLQSGAGDQAGQEQGDGQAKAGGLFSSLGHRPAGGGLGRYVEAWAYAVILIGLGFALIGLDLAWLLYLLVPLAIAGLWLRGL
jgi:hypothetical protein